MGQGGHAPRIVPSQSTAYTPAQVGHGSQAPGLVPRHPALRWPGGHAVHGRHVPGLASLTHAERYVPGRHAAQWTPKGIFWLSGPSYVMVVEAVVSQLHPSRYVM
jgi:hypothetical protein